MTEVTLNEMEEMIKEKEQELLSLKKEYRERRTSGLRQAMEQRREADKLVREEMKHLGVSERVNYGDDSFYRMRYYL
tara:strand:- start:899 stop:1129 length:231 start_codon:yes stop_codon:yes gene_type:complete